MIHNNSTNIKFKTLVLECYYDGNILSLTKPYKDSNLTFIMFTTKEARDDILNNGLTYHSKRLGKTSLRTKKMATC